MADTTTQDFLLSRYNANLTKYQNDKTTLENLANPSTDIVETINILEKKIQRVQAQITSTTQLKNDIIQKYNDHMTRRGELDAAYGGEICALVEEYH